MGTKKRTSSKATSKNGLAKRVPGTARKAAPVEASIAVLLQGSYQQQIRTIYDMSKEQAVLTLRKSGVLTAKGKLSSAYT